MKRASRLWIALFVLNVLFAFVNAAIAITMRGRLINAFVAALCLVAAVSTWHSNVRVR